MRIDGRTLRGRGADILVDGIIEAEVAARTVALTESGELEQLVAERQNQVRARGDTVVGD